MNKFNSKTFSPQNEVDAIVHFISTRWDFSSLSQKSTKMPPQDAFALFVDRVFMAGYDAAEGWVDRYGNTHLHEQYTIRKQFLRRNGVITPTYMDDVVYNYLSDLYSNVSYYQDLQTGKWDYTANIKKLIKELSSDFVHIKKLKPIGYAEFTKDYSDYDGQDEYCNTLQKSDEDEFGGIDCEGVRSFPFPARVALPYVAYDDICQGHKPFDILIGAIYAQGLSAHQAKNNAEIDETVDALDITQPFRTQDDEAVFPYSKIVEAVLECRNDYPSDATFVTIAEAVAMHGGTELTDELKEEIRLDTELKDLQAKMLREAGILLHKLEGIIIHNEWPEMHDPTGYEVCCAVIETNAGELKKLRFDVTGKVWALYD